jgi:hypothetical protein
MKKLAIGLAALALISLSADQGLRSGTVPRFAGLPVICSTGLSPMIHNPHKAQPLTGLIGLSFYALPYVPEGIDPYRFIDTLADAGFNHARIIIPSRCWHDDARSLPSPFKRSGDKYDLSKFDESFLDRFEKLMQYAARRGVIVQVDLFDEVMLHNWDFWIRSEWAAENNVNRWLGRQKPGPGAWTPLFYDPPAGTQPAWTLKLQEDYFDAVAARVPPPHLIGDGNELARSDFSLHFLERFEGPNPLVCGLMALTNVEDPSTDAPKQKALLEDPLMQRIFSRVNYIAVHAVEPESVERRFSFVEPILLKYPHLKVIFSTDGAGLGSSERRPDGLRPNAADIKTIIARARQLAGTSFGGVEVKLLDYPDFLSLTRKLSSGR